MSTRARTWANWSGGQECRPRRTDRPLDAAGAIAAVRRAAANGARIRPVGAGLSASPLVLTDDVHVDCSALTGVVALTESTVRVRAGETLRSLFETLAGHGRTLACFPNGPAATIAGAVSTGTHAGSQAGSLSAQVTGVRIVDGTGTLRTVDGSGDELDALRTGLGLFGVLTEIELRTVPLERIVVHEQAIDPAAGHEALDAHPWAVLDLHLPTGTALLRWAEPAPDEPVERVDEAERAAAAVGATGKARARLGQTASTVGHTIGHTIDTASAAWSRRPIPRWDPGTTGLPHQLLPDTRQSRGEVTEWAVPREALGSALREIGAAAAAREIEIRRPIEVRTGPAEPGWLHPAYGRASAWIAVRTGRGDEFAELFTLVGAVLEGQGGRPHWAGRHGWSMEEAAAAYPRATDFEDVRHSFDPQGVFLPVRTAS